MWVIVSYDLQDHRRVGNALRRILQRYLVRVQLSVWEGELSEVQVEQLKNEISRVVRHKGSVKFWLVRNPAALERKTLGSGKDRPIQRVLFL